MMYDSLTQSPFLYFVHLLIFFFFKSTTFREPDLLPSLGKEALNVVYPLDELLSVTALRSSYYQSMGSD